MSHQGVRLALETAKENAQDRTARVRWGKEGTGSPVLVN